MSTTALPTRWAKVLAYKGLRGGRVSASQTLPGKGLGAFEAAADVSGAGFWANINSIAAAKVGVFVGSTRRRHLHHFRYGGSVGGDRGSYKPWLREVEFQILHKRREKPAFRRGNRVR